MIKFSEKNFCKLTNMKRDRYYRCFETDQKEFHYLVWNGLNLILFSDGYNSPVVCSDEYSIIITKTSAIEYINKNYASITPVFNVQLTIEEV